MSKIPYNLQHIKAVAFDVDGVLSPTVVPLGDDGVPRRMANLKDGYALQLAVRKGLKICIISGGAGEGLQRRFALLGITDVYMGAGLKKDIFEQWRHANNLALADIAYVGDDLPDRECMEMVGLAVAPADAAPDIHRIADYISPCQGGYGVARDLLEEILRAQNLWPETDRASF